MGTGARTPGLQHFACFPHRALSSLGLHLVQMLACNISRESALKLSSSLLAASAAIFGLRIVQRYNPAVIHSVDTVGVVCSPNRQRAAWLSREWTKNML